MVGANRQSAGPMKSWLGGRRNQVLRKGNGDANFFNCKSREKRVDEKEIKLKIPRTKRTALSCFIIAFDAILQFL